MSVDEKVRKRFKVSVEDLKLGGKNLQRYRLKRGGATNTFAPAELGESDQPRPGKHVRTAKLYIDRALQDRAELVSNDKLVDTERA